MEYQQFGFGSFDAENSKSPSRLNLICVIERSWPWSIIGFCKRQDKDKGYSWGRITCIIQRESLKSGLDNKIQWSKTPNTVIRWLVPISSYRILCNGCHPTYITFDFFNLQRLATFINLFRGNIFELFTDSEYNSLIYTIRKQKTLCGVKTFQSWFQNIVQCFKQLYRQVYNLNCTNVYDIYNHKNFLQT